MSRLEGSALGFRESTWGLVSLQIEPLIFHLSRLLFCKMHVYGTTFDQVQRVYNFFIQKKILLASYYDWKKF